MFSVKTCLWTRKLESDSWPRQGFSLVSLFVIYLMTLTVLEGYWDVLETTWAKSEVDDLSTTNTENKKRGVLPLFPLYAFMTWRLGTRFVNTVKLL
jgi:hypothetical protein